jgi:hypothetical protein
MRRASLSRGPATVENFRDCRKVSTLKNLAGVLHTDGGGCTLSVGGEVKMEIPAKNILCILHPEC